MKNLLKYIYHLSKVVITVTGGCVLIILIVMGLGKLANPALKVQPDFTAITTVGWTFFWAVSLIVYLVGSVVWIVYHFIKNDNEETK